VTAASVADLKTSSCTSTGTSVKLDDTGDKDVLVATFLQPRSFCRIDEVCTRDMLPFLLSLSSFPSLHRFWKKKKKDFIRFCQTTRLVPIMAIMFKSS